MEIAVVQAPPEGVDADVLALPVRAPAVLPEAARELDRALEGRLRRLVDDGELKGEPGRVTLLHSDGRIAAPRVVAVGIGEGGADEADYFRTAAAAAVTRAGQFGGRTLAWLLEPNGVLQPAEQARAIVEGTALGTHRAGLWKTDGEAPPEIERLVLCGEGARPSKPRRAGRTSSRSGRTAAATSSTPRRTSSRPPAWRSGPRSRPAAWGSVSRSSGPTRSTPPAWGRWPPSARGVTILRV